MNKIFECKDAKPGQAKAEFNLTPKFWGCVLEYFDVTTNSVGDPKLLKRKHRYLGMGEAKCDPAFFQMVELSCPGINMKEFKENFYQGNHVTINNSAEIRIIRSLPYDGPQPF